MLRRILAAGVVLALMLTGGTVAEPSEDGKAAYDLGRLCDCSAAVATVGGTGRRLRPIQSLSSSRRTTWTTWLPISSA